MEKEQLKEEIIKVIKTVYDPEIPVNIFELGLIYNIDINDKKRVSIQMTLTSPACPVAGSMPIEIENKIYSVPEVDFVEVKVVWEPPWNQEMMSEAARLELGLF
jgi:FeS assembly SUF system protein